VDGAGNKYFVVIKRSSEGRRDRVIPLLSQAILEAQAFATGSRTSVVPLAMVAAQQIPPVVVDAVRAFADRVVPHMVVGLVDAEGLRAFWGHGLEILNARPSFKEHRARRQVSLRHLPRLFSDLNQWMLKILLAEFVQPDLLSAPKTRFKNPTGPARAANVSLMSAFRLVRQLQKDNLIDSDQEWLRLVRIPELMRRWSASSEPVRKFAVRSLIKQERAGVYAQLRTYAAPDGLARNSAVDRGRRPRVCLGLFAAADALGFGFRNGVPPHIYVERFDPAMLKKLGFSLDGAEHFVSSDEFVMKSMEGASTTYRRARPYTPSAGDLKAFAGRYENDELRAVLQMTPDKTALISRLNDSRTQLSICVRLISTRSSVARLQCVFCAMQTARSWRCTSPHLCFATSDSRDQINAAEARRSPPSRARGSAAHP